IEGLERDLVSVLEAKRDITHFISEGKVRVIGDYYQGIDLSRIALATKQSQSKS
ncbi:MAG: hypothetical protein HY261_08365, partial [Chloroflexi bacterium]|nr:hypothetical protein [Chloroflexota bacterium]